ncbi:MAG: hypothetical protein ABUL62_15415 [Myxococcales bacterium]
MKQLGWVCGVLSLSLSLVACGGRASTPGNAESGSGASSTAGSPNTTEVAGAPSKNGGSADTTDAGAPGVGPIDSTNLPTAFPEPLCVGPLASLHLALPCKVGTPLGGSLSVVECYDTGGRTALNFSVDVGSAADSIGRAVALPFDASGASPLSALPLPPIVIEVDGVPYQGVLHGSLTFEQVDPVGRGFVAFLTREFVAWTGPDGKETDCDYDPMRLWATAGDFL